MKKIILILLISTPCLAYDSWNTQDTIFQIAASSSIFVDMWQTYTFVYHPNFTDQHETNSVLTEHPSKKRFFAYSSICMIGHPLISALIPDRTLRNFWQLTWFCIELHTIHHNYQVGIRLNLP